MSRDDDDGREDPAAESGLSPELRRILEERTRALARPVAEDEERSGAVAIRIRVAGERFALDASRVQGVVALKRLAEIPLAPPHVAGLIVHGGEVIPVFHLRAVLDLTWTTLPERGHVVLVGAHRAEAALVVDELEALTRLEEANLVEAPASLSERARALARGVDDDGTLFLDGNELLQSDRLLVDIPLPHRSGAEAPAGDRDA